jgi:hypothetical protein
MWTCPKCKIDVDPGFEICWACGASRDGEETPGFNPEAEGIMGAAEYCAETEAKRREDLVTLATYWNAMEAHVVRSRLDAEGIPAIVTDELATTTTWGLLNDAGGVKVEVPEAQLEKAKNILVSCQHRGTLENRLVAQAVREGIQTEPAAPVATADGEDEARTGSAEQLIGSAYRAAFFGFLFLALPIHVYSFYLLRRSRGLPGERSEATQRKYQIALFLDLVVIGLWWLPLACLGFLLFMWFFIDAVLHL